MDEEAEEAYEAEANYFEEDEEYDEEIEEEEEEEGEEEPEIDYDAEIEEGIEIEKNLVIQKINELDHNHLLENVNPDQKRWSSHIIQIPELTEAIGIRISQIERGAPVFTDVTGLHSPIEMAKKEFIDRQNPLILCRAMESKNGEMLTDEWKVREMTFPISDKEILSITDTHINQLLSSKK